VNKNLGDVDVLVMFKYCKIT